MEIEFYCVGDKEKVKTKPDGYRFTQPRVLLDGSEGEPKVYAYAKCPNCGRNITRFVSPTDKILKKVKPPKGKELKKTSSKKASSKKTDSKKKVNVSSGNVGRTTPAIDFLIESIYRDSLSEGAYPGIQPMNELVDLIAAQKYNGADYARLATLLNDIEERLDKLSTRSYQNGPNGGKNLLLGLLDEAKRFLVYPEDDEGGLPSWTSLDANNRAHMLELFHNLALPFDELVYEPAPPGEAIGQSREATLPFDTTEPLLPLSDWEALLEGLSAGFKTVDVGAVASAAASENWLAVGAQAALALEKVAQLGGDYNEREAALIKAYNEFSRAVWEWARATKERFNEWAFQLRNAPRQRRYNELTGRVEDLGVPKAQLDLLNAILPKLYTLTDRTARMLINNWRKAKGHRNSMSGLY